MSDDGGPDDSDDRPVGAVSLSLDATLELLADHDRRAVLSYLREDQTATVGELADHVVARGARTGEGERPDRDEVLATLHHVHLPKLADEGVVDYDARNGEVRYWGSDRLETWHEHVRRLSDE